MGKQSIRKTCRCRALLMTWPIPLPRATALRHGERHHYDTIIVNRLNKPYFSGDWKRACISYHNTRKYTQMNCTSNIFRSNFLGLASKNTLVPPTHRRQAYKRHQQLFALCSIRMHCHSNWLFTFKFFLNHWSLGANAKIATLRALTSGSCTVMNGHDATTEHFVATSLLDATSNHD